MVRNSEGENVSANVFLINGEKFFNKDIPSMVFGETEKSVYFWDDDKLVIYPMSQVEKVELIFND